jgi:hypothetical protein
MRQSAVHRHDLDQAHTLLEYRWCAATQPSRAAKIRVKELFVLT